MNFAVTATALLLGINPSLDLLKMESGKGHTFRSSIDNKGRTSLVVGEFNIGADLTEDKTLTARVAQFVQIHHKAFGLNEVGLANLTPTQTLTVDQKTTTVVFTQSIEGLRVHDGDIYLTFDNYDNSLDYIVGAFADPDTINLATERKISEVISAILASGVEVSTDFESTTSALGTVFQSKSTGDTLERAVDYGRDSVVWLLAKKGQRVLLLDEQSLEITMVPLTDGAYPTSCDIRHSRPLKVGTNTTNFLSLDPSTAVHTRTCEAVISGGVTCLYQLRYTDAANGSLRVNDSDDSNEQSSVQSCPASSTPEFLATTGDALQEQTGFYSLATMHSQIKAKVWDNATAIDFDDVAYNFDVNTSTCSATACFGVSGGIPTINVEDSKANQIGTIFHEYGHYVVWSYGDVSNNCASNGGDQGNMIDETLGDVFGFFGILGAAEFLPTYESVDSFGNGQAPAAHVGSGTNIQFSETCTVDAHDMGKAFEAAMWEVLWNRDCVAAACTSPVGFGTQIFGSTTRAAVLEDMGSALGSTLALSGQSISFATLTTLIISRVEAVTGSATIAARVEDVFQHHNVIP